MTEKGFWSWRPREPRPSGAGGARGAEAGQPPPEAAPAAAPPEPAGLSFSRSHVAGRLWALWSGASDGEDGPRLSLTGPDAETPYPAPDRELPRLRALVSATAAARMRRLLARAEEGAAVDLDAEAVVFTDRDGLWAWVLAYPPVGRGTELSLQALEQALAAAGVRYGVDQVLLGRLPQRQDRYFKLHLIARGLSPVHGRDGVVIDCFPRSTERRFVVNERNQMDYTALNLVQNVEKGAVICRILPPTAGTPGRTVGDAPIAPRPGKPAAVPKGRNTELSGDGACLVAAATGHVAFTGRNFEIRCTLDIPGDVDYSTGSLNYLGDIHIRGDVRSGFTVRAMGSVTVDGSIEDTSVEAGGDLIVGGGVQGNGKAVIRAHRNVYAKYLENCSAYIKGDLHSDCVISCQVYCDGEVHVTTGRGAVIGGGIHAGGTVRASTVGARTEVRTLVALGGCPCEDFERGEVLRELEEMERDMERAQRQPGCPARDKHLSELRLKTAVSRMKLEKFARKLEQSAGAPEENAPQCRLHAKMLYPGAVISIGGDTRRVQKETRSCTAALVEDRIEFLS